MFAVSGQLVLCEGNKQGRYANPAKYVACHCSEKGVVVGPTWRAQLIANGVEMHMAFSSLLYFWKGCGSQGCISSSIWELVMTHE